MHLLGSNKKGGKGNLYKALNQQTLKQPKNHGHSSTDDLACDMKLESEIIALTE
jgi:hypothetical protein